MYYLALPFCVTLGNLFFVLLTNYAHSQPVIQDALLDRCIGTDGHDCGVLLDDYVTGDIQGYVPPLEQDDPMLREMPGTDGFKAYVKADIATFYQKEPGTMVEMKPAFKGQAGKFINMSPERLDLYWVGDRKYIFSGSVGPWRASGTSTFPGHQFVFKRHGKEDVVARFHVVEGTSVYYYDPYLPNDVRDSGRGFPDDEMPPIDVRTLAPKDREQYDAHKYNLAFGKMYKNFTGGTEWLAMYPAEPPVHPIWPADYFGQEHHVITAETQFKNIPPESELHRLSTQEMLRNGTEIAFPEYRQRGKMNLTITAASCAPRVFKIENFLSDVEVDHLHAVIAQMELERSTTAGHKSETRTSRTTWMARSTDAVVDAIFRRAANAMRLDEAILRNREADERPDISHKKPFNEDLQIVHYSEGQEYTAHHDFGYPDGIPGNPNRAINFCMYLNDTPKGGETAFVRWRNAETTTSFTMKPKKGSALIFYMVLPDGNLDDLSQHAALPVIEGEKWFSNLWIHQPYRE